MSAFSWPHYEARELYLVIKRMERLELHYFHNTLIDTPNHTT